MRKAEKALKLISWKILRCYNLLGSKQKPKTKAMKCYPSLKYLPSESKPNYLSFKENQWKN